MAFRGGNMQGGPTIVVAKVDETGSVVQDIFQHGCVNSQSNLVQKAASHGKLLGGKVHMFSTQVVQIICECNGGICPKGAGV